MYADRVEASGKTSVKERLNGNSGQYFDRIRQITRKRQRHNDDNWEHDLYVDDEEPQVLNRKVGARDLRLKLQKKSSEQVYQSKKGIPAGGVRDLREKLSGTTPSQPRHIDLPKIKPVLEASKPTSRSVAVEAPEVAKPARKNVAVETRAAETIKVPDSGPSRKKAQKKAEKSVDGLLQSLGLDKYKITFQAEEIDMTALMHMTEEDLKALGIPMGPRKKIILALNSGV